MGRGLRAVGGHKLVSAVFLEQRPPFLKLTSVNVIGDGVSLLEQLAHSSQMPEEAKKTLLCVKARSGLRRRVCSSIEPPITTLINIAEDPTPICSNQAFSRLFSVRAEKEKLRNEYLGKPCGVRQDNKDPLSQHSSTGAEGLQATEGCWMGALGPSQVGAELRIFSDIVEDGGKK